MGTVPGHPRTPGIGNFEYRDLRGSPMVLGGTGGTKLKNLTKAKNMRYS